MKNKTEKSENFCRTCGFIYKKGGLIYRTFYPWGKDNKSPTMDICSCCGVQFGYEDCKRDAMLSYREKWLSSGAEWFSGNYKPSNWDLEKQLKNIPDKYK